MVEGPGCTGNGRRARAHLGKRVIRITGDGVTELPQIFVGARLVDVLTLGKELWLFFVVEDGTEMALRLHFGMNGAMCLDGVKPKYHGRTLTLAVRYESGHALDVYGSAIKLERSAAEVRAKHREGLPRDVCADNADFNASSCVAALVAHPDKLVADAVLNQAVLPGCGNIIKNEALHRARVLPDRHVASLSPAELNQIVAEVRAFSVSWMKQGRAGPLLIYNRTSCGDCMGPVKMQKIGADGLPRATFWCNVCCSGSKTTVPSVSRLPVTGHHQASTGATSHLDGVIFYGGIDVAVPRKRIADCTTSDSAVKRLCATPMALKSGPSVASGDAGGALRSQTGVTVKSKMSAEALGVIEPLAVCHNHGRSSLALKRVRKQGQNHGRLFFTCQTASCNFFQWADRSFPCCQCPSRRIATLRVSKKEPSAGRWFFSCGEGAVSGSSAVSRCKFFAWATSSQLQPLGDLLKPLT